ncbi:hypothetical protein GGD63_000659 [Bradyrhizobium sp. cir1]|uniref:hypothetical protein n=1 Tax=Bradyrhizobium sp. cir1 TaxID=1445730 RepID=UPI001606CB31|nr:hypothetical protein [Bradyrhizobium sp. cir1]MBB4367890.1 hypothetical protein [Bradyrhizobium sp. cir1]
MHGHKLHYFQSTAKELKTFFGNFIDEKLRELNKIVSTAEQNIQLYNKNVSISNNNLTKNWLDQLGSIRSTRERTMKSLRVIDQIPARAGYFESVATRRSSITKFLYDHAHHTARQLESRVRLEIARNLRWRLEELRLWDQEAPLLQSEKIASDLVGIDPDTLLPLVPANIVGDWSGLREAKAHAVREAAADLRRLCDELATLIAEKSPVRECETEVLNAQNSLTLDLDQFFRNAELYRDGVFSHTTKESISTLGIGARLDALESEFTQSDTTAFTNETMRTLFPDFNDVSTRALTSFAAIEKDLRPLIAGLGELKIPSPVTGTREIAPSIEAEQKQLQTSITGELSEDIRHLTGRLDIQLSSTIAEANQQYNADILNARRRRRWRYITAMLGTVGLASVAYLFYIYVNRDVPQDMLNSIAWNLVAEVIAVGVGWGIAKWFDDFPKTTARILGDSRSILKGKVFNIVDEALNSHDFSTLDEAKLAEKLSASYARLIEIDPDGWEQIATERIDALRHSENDYRRLRAEYEVVMDDVFDHTSSYFSDATKNLDRLTRVAARVKERAIEPSFELLAETRASLEQVKNQIRSVEFQT